MNSIEKLKHEVKCLTLLNLGAYDSTVSVSNENYQNTPKVHPALSEDISYSNNASQVSRFNVSNNAQSNLNFASKLRYQAQRPNMNQIMNNPKMMPTNIDFERNFAKVPQ